MIFGWVERSKDVEFCYRRRRSASGQLNAVRFRMSAIGEQATHLRHILLYPEFAGWATFKGHCGTLECTFGYLTRF